MFPSRKASYQQACAVDFVQNTEHQKENKTRAMKRRRKSRHASEQSLPCVATIPEHRPGANGANTGFIIFKGLLVSQQKISSSKLLCRYHTSHYISRTRDLCSYCSVDINCSTQASFARASASYLSSPQLHPARKPPAPPNHKYTQAHAHTKNHTLHVFLSHATA